MNAGFLRLAEYRQYRHPIVSAHINDNVVHAGGFDGYSTICFAGDVGPSGSVHVFEPDPTNVLKFKKRILSIEELANRVILKQMALGSRCDSVSFAAKGDSTSSVCDTLRSGNDIRVQMVMIDSLTELCNVSKIDMIALDVEGYELEVLKRSRETLAKFRPKLQISVYHDCTPGQVDLIAIWKYIVDLQLNYTFYLGHHDVRGNETVLYAIAK